MVIYQSICITQSVKISDQRSQGPDNNNVEPNTTCGVLIHRSVESIGNGHSTLVVPFALIGTSESWQMLWRTNTKGRHDGHISSTNSEALHFPPHISVFWADSRPIPKLIKRGNSCKLVPSDLTKYSKISWSNLQMFRHLPIIWVSCIAAQIIQWNFCSLSTLSHWSTSGFTDVEAIKKKRTKKCWAPVQTIVGTIPFQSSVSCNLSQAKKISH